MFYVKEAIGESTIMKIEITDENVYNTCPRCGAEVLVNLSDMAGDKNFDLFGTAVCCAECSKVLLNRGNDNG